MKNFFCAVIITVVAFTGCSKIETLSGLEGLNGKKTAAAGESPAGIRLLILNEGAFPGASTLDMLDLGSGEYYEDIFAQANPDRKTPLGNTGNDMVVTGNTLWLAMNASNQVVVLSAFNYKLLAEIEVDSPRSMIAYGDYVYVTSYAAAVYGGTPTLGFVYRISVKDFTYSVVQVGYQPEGLAIIGEKLYVANSGGFNATHDNTVSMVDLSVFDISTPTELPVTNLNMMRESRGKLWISTYGESDWSQDAGGNWIQSVSAPMSLVAFSTDGKSSIIPGVHADKVTESGGIIYAIGNDAEMTGGYDLCLYKVNCATEKLVETVHFKDTDLSKITNYPYAILVNPDNGDILIADASFTGDSTLRCFTKAYKQKWQVTTGVGTGHLLLYRY